MKTTNKPLLLILVHIIIYYLNECTAELTNTTIQESTVGFNLIDTGSQFTDNTIVLRAVRLDYTNGICNEPKISFRTVIPGQGATVYSLDLGDDGNARIPQDNFCPPTPSKRKRWYIFYDNYKRDKSMRRVFHKRTPTTTVHSEAKSSKSTSPASSANPASPDSPKGGKSPEGPTPAPEPSSSPAPAPSPSSSPASAPSSTPSPSPAPKSEGPKAANDKIKVLTFYNEFVLIYYPCGGKFCGDIYSIKNINHLVKNIELEGNCDETNAVQGPNGFLYLCYHDVDSSIIWESWTTDGAEFNKAYGGSISNVTVPNKLESESFGGGLFKVFAAGPSQYSIIMGSFAGKPNPKNNVYNPPIELFAYFLTDATLISGPYPIYQNIQNNQLLEVEFQIQACNPIEGGSGGYKCLLSIKSNGLNSYTKFVAITFSATGEQLSTVPFEFDIQHAPDAKTPATLNLNNGGWCIGVYSQNVGLDCLVYDENGVQHDTWGIPTGNYGALGGTPNNIMWAVKSFSDPLSWITNLATNLPVIENTDIGKGAKYTIFAPSDQAFGKIGKLNPEAINNILRYHIIPIEAKSSDFNKIQYQPTLIGSPELGIPNAKQKLIIKNDNGVITVGNGNIMGKVVNADNLASNGVIHIIDSIILLPESPMKAMNNINDLNYFGQVITGANLANTFEDFVGVTIFAPSNDAMLQAPKELLSTSNLTQLTRFINYHVVPRVIFSGIIIGPTYNQESKEGSTLKISNDENVFSVNDIKVIKPDILLNDGVLHIIEKYVIAPGIPNYTQTSSINPPSSTISTDPSISTNPSTPKVLSNSNDVIIISSVLGGIVGMAAIGIILTILFCKKQKRKAKTNSVTYSHYSEAESHAPTNFTQRSDDMSPHSSNHEPMNIFDRNYPSTNHEPMSTFDNQNSYHEPRDIVDARNMYSNESNIGGKIPLSSVSSETSSVYEEIGGAPASYNPNPSNTNSVHSSNSNPSNYNLTYTSSNSSNPAYSSSPAHHFNPVHSPYPVHTRPSTSYNIDNRNNNNTRTNARNNRNMSSSNYYSPHDFPYNR
ncbi:fasciclin domain-containing protein [Rhizophagus irregularis DAOM 181602=DAOM 197198]|nr:fasciclin domain-containing protein [Rhizophagus irregularis DAOM 181602=DAOM 197198]